MFTQLSGLIRRSRAAQHKLTLMRQQIESAILHEDPNYLPHPTIHSNIAAEAEWTAADLGIAVVEAVGETDPADVVILSGDVINRVASVLEWDVCAAFDDYIDHPGKESGKSLEHAKETLRLWGQDPELVIGAHVFQIACYGENEMFAVIQRATTGVGRMEVVEGLIYDDTTEAQISAGNLNSRGIVGFEYDVMVIERHHADRLTDQWNEEMVKDATKGFRQAS